jgi:hypothetical protein
MVSLGNIPKAPSIKASNPNGHWVFPEKMGMDGKVGFVYAIRDLVLKRGYIGKKQYRVLGVTKGGEETAWRKYKSSSTTMSQLFAQRPIDEFEFYCIEEYSTKSGLSFAETWSLCMVEAPTTPNWYNTRIEKVGWTVRENVTFRHKQRLAAVSDWSDVG